MKITILSPHRDDAAFSVGLTIWSWLKLGHYVQVVNCFTQSQYSPFSSFESLSPSEICSHVTALRRREDVCWCKHYQPEIEVIDLNLVDAPQRLHCNLDDVCREEVVADDPTLNHIRTALDRQVVDALVLPLGIGTHVDHLTARTAAQHGWPAILPVAFYEDLPYAARPGEFERIDAWASRLAGGLETWFASEAGDVQAAIKRKRELSLCYDSQIDLAAADQIASFCARYGGRERLWVNQAWRDAGPGVSS